MSRVENPEPDNPDDVAMPEVFIRITVPEEFMGSSMGELNGRGGLVMTIDCESSSVVIRASLPASEYEALSIAISSATLRRGKVEREPPLPVSHLPKIDSRRIAGKYLHTKRRAPFWVDYIA